MEQRVRGSDTAGGVSFRLQMAEICSAMCRRQRNPLRQLNQHVKFWKDPHFGTTNPQKQILILLTGRTKGSSRVRRHVDRRFSLWFNITQQAHLVVRRVSSRLNVNLCTAQPRPGDHTFPTSRLLPPSRFLVNKRQSFVDRIHVDGYSQRNQCLSRKGVS